MQEIILFMTTDLTFITNEPGKKLLDRFKDLIKNTRLFDVLVGYFYTSGFYALYKDLEKTEKIRILIGINTNKQTYDLIQQSREEEQLSLQYSHAQAKEIYRESVTQEMELSEDKSEVEEGVNKFIEWLRSGKLEIKAYPSENIHAKLYIMTFAEGDRDIGRVITGSSNFSRSGLMDNLEFNVELKNAGDYDFALAKFNQLWQDAVDVKDQYLETIQTNTWIGIVSPYELYLKFLYEYLKEKINIDLEEISNRYVPENFMDLEYQREAVKDAKNKLEEYGGVFISDVVGLGKTYVSAMLAQQLDGRNLIICPPVLEEYWQDTFSDFRVPADVESLGMLDKLINKGTEKYKNIFIDEAHRFRNESTQTYAKLKQICWGKRIILISATPQNNTPYDLLSQIKLFQKGRNSTIPNIKNLEQYFTTLQKQLHGIDRHTQFEQYLSIIRANSAQIRENILKYLMVRRTRTEVKIYFVKDLTNQRLKFPEVTKPNRVFYEFDRETDRVFTQTIEKIKQFKYARYTPILYLKEPDPEEVVGQRNLRRFMKILLVKRLESSFFAFKMSIDRFIVSYRDFIAMVESGTVYISKKYTEKIFELLEEDDEAKLLRLVEEEKVRKFKINEFKPEYLDDLNQDLQTLREIRTLWKNINTDPKLIKFKRILSSDKLLKENKLLVFSESKETAEYLEKNLQPIYQDKVISFSSISSEFVRDRIIENFDPKHRNPKDDLRILISTEILSEGVNLHRANIVINYDLPWNPTRVIQRVGRVNRVDTKFDNIYIYNFFPTVQSNNEIKLEEAAIGKIQAFHDMLGDDAAYLTDGEEISSHALFTRVNSKQFIEGEEETTDSELKYLSEIRAIRDNQPDIFETIKHLPKKARSAKRFKVKENAVVTFFRRGKLRKMFVADSSAQPRELDFFNAAELLRATPEIPREKLQTQFYEYLAKNKHEFIASTIEEPELIPSRRGGRSSEVKLTHIVKAILRMKGFTDDDEEYLRKVLNLLEEGILPKQTAKSILKHIGKETNHIKIYGIIRKNISDDFFAQGITEPIGASSGPREVILSEYLVQ